MLHYGINAYRHSSVLSLYILQQAQFLTVILIVSSSHRNTTKNYNNNLQNLNPKAIFAQVVQWEWVPIASWAYVVAVILILFLLPQS